MANTQFSVVVRRIWPLEHGGYGATLEIRRNAGRRTGKLADGKRRNAKSGAVPEGDAKESSSDAIDITERK